MVAPLGFAQEHPSKPWGRSRTASGNVIADQRGNTVSQDRTVPNDDDDDEAYNMCQETGR